MVSAGPVRVSRAYNWLSMCGPLPVVIQEAADTGPVRS